MTINDPHQLRLSVVPRDGALWRKRHIEVTGATPGAIVTIRTRTDRFGHGWSSQASYVADDNGRIDVDHQPPYFGDYRSADPMGLIWSQRPDEDSAPFDISTAKAEGAFVTHLSAFQEPGTGLLDGPLGVDAPAGDETTLVQRLIEPEVTRIVIEENGLKGTLFRPAGDGPFPTVIVLNGSGGGINEVRAAAYASRGIQALALGYFKVPGLSPYISNTPLEYFEKALDYVIDNLRPRGGRPAVSGQSRGGELTYLLGATYPDKIAALVGYVPGAFVCGAQGAADPAQGWSGPTWTLEGRPLEHLWHDNAGVSWQPWTGGAPEERNENVYIDGFHDRRLAQASRIRIENFQGPVMCVAGLDDGLWPGSYSGYLVCDTLRRHGHHAERLRLDYEYAGHSITVPYVPTTQIHKRHPVSGIDLSTGGTAQGNARASVDSFERTCEFLERTCI